MASRYDIVRWGPAPYKEPEPPSPPVALPKPSSPMTPETLEGWIVSQIKTELYSYTYGNPPPLGQKSDLELLLDANNSSFRALIRGIVKVFREETQRQYNESCSLITELERHLNELKDKI